MRTKISVPADLPDAELNLVPCKIQYTGPADANKLFTTSKRPERWQNKNVVTSSFRGLKLIGEEVPLRQKAGYVCNTTELVKECENEDAGSESIKEFTAIAKFEKLTVYGHDSCAPATNKWKMLNEWDEVANAIHS